MFELLHTTPGGQRRGRLTLPAGHVIETPQFMPVGTAGTVKAVPPWELEGLGTTILLGNTYHLYLRPGHERVERLGGLAKMTAWDGPTLTDSGGFQVFSLEGLRKIDDDGVTFASHLDGSRHRFTPEHSMRVQRALGSDIVMAFDECPPYPATEAQVRAAMRRTTAWARRGLDFELKPHQTRFVIVQGGLYERLRREHALELCALDLEEGRARGLESGAFEGFAIGGLSIGEEPAQMQEMCALTAPLLPDAKPRYLMGVGRPEDLVECVRGGVDLFDCVMPTRNARNGQAFTREGKLNIKNTRYSDDPSPLDPACACPTCRRFTRAYLRHLYVAGEALLATLLTLHNLAYYLGLMAEMREAIAEDRFESWRALFYAARGEQAPG